MKKNKMEPVLMVILMLSFTSGSTEKQKSAGGREVEAPAAFPDAPPVFHRVEKVERAEAPIDNDADIFWEVTKGPEGRRSTGSDVVDGNPPDNEEITTHDHVDRAIGHVPATKRVKKILPPFDGKKMRNARHIEVPAGESGGDNSLGEAKKETPDPGDGGRSTAGPEPGTTSKDTIRPQSVGTAEEGPQIAGAAETTPLGPPEARATAAAEEDGASEFKIRNPEFLSTIEVGDPRPTAGEIEGIRLVPDDFGMLMPSAESREREEEKGEEGEAEEGAPSVQKSIWDLLKEREQVDPSRLDDPGLENPKNETTDSPAETTKSMYEHFDADSAEVEFETENFNRGSNIEKHELPLSYAMSWLQMKDKEFDGKESEARKNGTDGRVMEIPKDVSKLLQLTESEKSVNGVTVSIINSGSGDYARYGRRPSKWYLLLLTGNSTIVKLRRKDFTKYLKLNLAARLSVEYDDVKVNKVILAPPKVLVNISVFAPSDDVAEESQMDVKEKMSDKGEAPLYKLAETNATLLELSGEEYHVVRFLSLESQAPEAEAHKDAVPVSIASRQNDVEFVIYTLVGSAFACALILTFLVTLNRYFKKVSDFDWPRLKPRQAAWKARDDGEPEKDEFNGVSPAVIYSGGFPQIRGSWMSGVGSRGGQRGAPSVPQYPGIELGGSPPHRRNSSIYPDLEERPCSSPRHSRLQIYNCDANSLVIPMPLQNKAIGKGKLVKSEGSDTHPLDVRIRGEKSGQDNPIFTN